MTEKLQPHGLESTNNTGGAITFDLADLLTGTATSGADYSALPAGAQITILDGQSTGTFTINVIDDPTIEPVPETVNLQISNSSNPAVSILVNSVVALITSNE